MKFEAPEIVWTKDELANGMSLHDFASRLLEADEKIVNKGKSKSFLGKSPDADDKRALLHAIKDSNRYKECEVTNLAACNGTVMWDAGRSSTISEDSQWAAMTIRMNDEEDSSIVAMRGTDSSALGWGEDAELGFEPYGTTAQKLSRDYLNATEAEHIYMTGHSKGGNNVSSAYMMSEKNIRDKVVRVDNYDGPGNNNDFVQNFHEGYKELENKQHNYYPRFSIFGQLLDSPGDGQYVDAHTDGHQEERLIGEHNPYSWYCDDGNAASFKKPDSILFPEISKAFNRALDSVVDSLSNSEIQQIIAPLTTVVIPLLFSDSETGKVELNEQCWQNIFMGILHFKFTSLEAQIAAIKLYYNFIVELGAYGIIHTANFVIPGFEDFMYSIKECFSDLFRNFKEAGNRLWNRIIYAITGHNEKDSRKAESKKPVYNFIDKTQGTYVSNCSITVYFSVDVDILDICSNSIRNYSESIKSIGHELKDIQNSLHGIGRILGELPIDTIILNTNKMASKLESLSESLRMCSNRYKDAENCIVSNIR